MKKVFISVFTLVLAFLLIGCSSKVKITFESNEGTAVAAIEAKAGAKITKPADPTLEDMTFGGWYSDIDLTEKYEFPETMPEKSIKLYAKWVVTLKFQTNGANAVADLVGESGEFFKAPESPKKDGFVFVGWYMDQEWNTPLVTVMPKKNATAYARWQVYETGSAITLSDNWTDNDGAFMVSKDEAGTKFTATSGKAEWSYVYTKINLDATKNTTVVIEFKGTKDCPVVFKLEGGDAAMTETKVDAMTGEDQKLEWSVKAENLTAVGGQMFMFFLNGGATGCSEVPEYIQIKSIKLYRTLEANDEQKAAIYFNSNQGDPVATIYEKAGTAIAKPADPTRAGYKFMGWFTEAAFTNEFVFNTMPATGAMLFAKWEPDGVKLDDVNLLGEQWNVDVAAAYEVVSTAEVLTIKKLAVGEEWSWIALPMTGKELATYKTLRVTIKGVQGEKILFKINDLVERWITCTGKVQELELPFDVALNPEKSLVVFANAGVKGESGVFEITRLAYGNYDSYQNLLDKEWEASENGGCTFEYKDGLLKVVKTAGGPWDHIKVALPEVNFDGYNLLRVTVKGTSGEQMLFKVNDAKEKWVTCTGEEQLVEFLYKLDYDKSKVAMVVFPNANSEGTGNEFVISQLELLCVPNPEDIELTDKQWSSLDEGIYQISKEVTMNKIAQGGEWDNIAIKTEEDLTGINKLLVTVKGTADEEIMFKVNDQGGELEKKIKCTGEVQELEFDLNLTYNPANAAMIIFCNPGTFGTGHDFVVSRLVLTGADKEIDLMKASWNVPDKYVVSTKVKISKTTAGTEWQCAVVKLENPDFFGLTKFVASFQGTAGEEILFKVNDQGGSFEKRISCTGELQEVTIDLTSGTINPAAFALVLFCNPEKLGTGNEFVIYSAAFTK